MKYSSDTNGIKEFIKNEFSLKVDENTVFLRDLHLIGDEAYLFMELFSKEFDVDLSNFDFDEYCIIESPLYWFDHFFRKHKHQKREFDLQHLEKVVKVKKWIDV